MKTTGKVRVWHMKVLFIGGTGTISSEITRQHALDNYEVWLLNGGNHNSIFQLM